ncbi:hypothetical protein J3B02_004775, partial [Coemansia erecta]
MTPIVPDTLVYPFFGVNDSQAIYTLENIIGTVNKSSRKQYSATMTSSSTLSYVTTSNTDAQPQPSLIAPDITLSPEMISKNLDFSTAISPSSSSSAAAAAATLATQNNGNGSADNASKRPDPDTDVAFQSQATSVTAGSAAKESTSASTASNANKEEPSLSTGNTANIESSLLLKPYSIDCHKLDSASASMDTPKSLQNGSEASTCISPLDMLIAALDPKKSRHPSTDTTTTTAAAAAALETGIAGGFWDPSIAGSQCHYSGINWDTISSGAAAAAAAVAASTNMNTHSFDA